MIVLSGRSGETDRIVGLDLGADDYLVKPFSPGELAARVRSVLRRARPAAAGAAGGVRVGWRSTPRRGRSPSTARPSSSPRGSSTCWPSSSPTPARSSAAPSCSPQVWRSEGWQGEATVTEHVHRLRHKLGLDPAAHPRIRTVRGVGYQLDP